MSTKSESKKIVKKDLISLFWRAFLLPACYSMDRMQAPGFAYSILPVLKKLYGDDKEKLAEACSPSHLRLMSIQIQILCKVFPQK